MRRVLVLGGTGEARMLAARLADAPSVEVISSLAGRVREPVLPVGQVRVGGFGGVDGLTHWLRDNEIDAVVDATHPFAAQITANAAAATARVGVPLLVLRRREWAPGPGDDWHVVRDLAAGAEAVAGLGERVFLTIGRQGVDAFADGDGWFLIRAIDPPEVRLPEKAELLLARGPFTVGDEVALLRERRIDVVVTKNSGGALTSAKLEAAREVGVPVVMVARTPIPEGIASTSDLDVAAAWAADGVLPLPK
ncbi:cobalt-precorrin-6A reductase [Prescottella equi]|jgi:precorrin-6A/cobalt-precorrin-6A reductase|uniref:cobalt-precorrin-6A reductase n=1 Tax=Rhodococcus hoagii TaxID=43767 RepID=UPI0007CD706B|nr:cobalt-precorrin-6A reductase [Prescottella equi]MBM4536820.1 cobalt-precorrin-6A reductase [Prescottella equi]MBM4553824.1 cobalt-precorrin-6A reductase [Prescottella equi]MBM4631066.1 cobalt-precorrin-6A reductase [Prescottella equi]MDP8014381.1 cobalt-precorrin-6A reductase [Prescottella equi]NKR25818.1 cobalt-precorrin-6A reductase [Prescottella equi]